MAEHVFILAGLTVLFTLLAIVTVLKLAQRQERTAEGRVPVHDASTAPPAALDVDLLARYVRDESGQGRGESVRASGIEVVLKNGEKYYVVPRGTLSPAPDGVLLARGVDWTAAEARGQEWLESQRDLMHYDDDGMPIAERPE